MGGAIEGVMRLGEAYRAMGHSQHLLTLDAPSDPWVAKFPSPVTALGWPGTRKRFYPYQAIDWLRTHMRDFDGIVVDGLWNASTLAAARVLPGAGVPYAVFPHGMLDPWFRQVQPAKEWVKRQLFRFNEGPLLRGAKAVLFTSEQERELARTSWPGWQSIDERVFGFGTGEPPAFVPAFRDAFLAAVPGLDDRPYLLFLSRVHPKKGCELLLEGFAAQPAMNNWQLVVAGTGRSAYLEELAALAGRLEMADRVKWSGMLSGDAKWGALYGCEAMVLTSFQENFGVVVAETMACRRPVLISNQVNIHGAVSAGNAGLICDPQVHSITDMLGRFAAISGEGRQAMGLAGRTMFESSFSMKTVAAKIIELFRRDETILDKELSYK